MDEFKPFADDETSLGVADFTAENGTDRIAIYGSLDLTRDKIGLRHARTLRALFETIVKVLESDPLLPDEAPPSPSPMTSG